MSKLPIPEPEDKKPLMIKDGIEYIEWLKTMQFFDPMGNPITPDYEEMVPPKHEFPLLILWVQGNPIMRSIGLN